MYTYPTFSTHLSRSRYCMSRLWLLSHDLSYINFFLLLHSLNTLSIEQNSSSGSAFQKTPATVFRFNRWSCQDFENAQEKTYHSKQKKCRVTYLLQLPTFAVDEFSSLLKVICILIDACMIDFIVDFCSSLKTYPCTFPVYCTSAVHECRITRHCPKAIPFTPMHTSFHSRDVQHGTTGWDKQMVSRVSVSTKVLTSILIIPNKKP